MRNARWVPLDARLDTGTKDRKPSIELVRRAEITQTTGEDWSNVTLGVSTVRTARGGSAPDLNSLIVQYPPFPLGGFVALRTPCASGHFDAPASASAAAVAEEALKKPADEQQAVPKSVLSRWRSRFRGASASAPMRAPRACASPPPPLRRTRIRSVPVVDPTAFLEASFVQSEDAPLLPGQVAIYRDGMFVGRGKMAAAGKDETVRLGFGADDKVKIERAVVKRNEGSAGLIVTSKTDERAFKTTVRNGHDFAIKVAVEDQLPVSENEDIAVEMLPSTTPPTTTNVHDKRGVLEWAFEAKPGEVKEINFAWRVRWPKDKGVVMVPAG